MHILNAHLNAFGTKSHHQTIHKFGVQVSRGNKEALVINKTSQNNFWKELLDKEVQSINNHATFCALDEEEPVLEGCIKTLCHF